jgi:hypothetical protein
MTMMSKRVSDVFNETANNCMSIFRYITTVYLSFTNGIPSEAEHLFDSPDQWPSYCGNANTGKFQFLTTRRASCALFYFDCFRSFCRFFT